jgi:hypothetical protein
MWREGLKDGESGIGGGEMAKATAVGKIGFRSHFAVRLGAEST